jgi:hypothetical protein
VEEEGFTFPVLPVLAWDEEGVADYRVPGTPFFYVVDGKGMIAEADFAKTEEKLQALVKRNTE